VKKNTLLIALLIYGIFSLATLFSWHTKGINSVTGDEPHYLVMSSGIVKQGSLEQTAPYREEFKAREIYKHGLAPADAQPSPENTHAVMGPNGLFNVHNIGLPLLLTLPFLFGGVLGAKLLMVFFGSLVVIVGWKFSSYFSENQTHRLWALIVATISLPLIPLSNQIYPDVLAGLIALTGLYWFLTLHERRTAVLEALLAATIVFLPWLQIKFAATCLVLVLSISLRIYFQSKDLNRIFRVLIIAGVSCTTMAAYNHYAFGNIFGPYQSGALEISKTSAMVLLGLHIDQNQGFILQNPVNLIGILAIGWMYKLNRTFALVWALVFLSLIVPNALHPHWYGGGGFSGRFQWAAAIVFTIPTIYGLLVISKFKENIFKSIIASGVLLQLYFFYHYAIIGINLYTKTVGTRVDAYSIFYYPIQAWMPLLYDSNWAYGYWPNYFWTILGGALLLIGFINKDRISRKTSATLAVSLFLLFFVAGLSKSHPKDETIFKADQLPSQTGRKVNSNRLAEQNLDKPGFTTFGPYFSLRKGSYEIVISYKSSSKKEEVIGWADVSNATTGYQLIQIPIQGTDNVTSKLTMDFESKQWKENSFEFRTYWNGVSTIEVQEIVLRRN
jgi:hypothetical protein